MRRNSILAGLILNATAAHGQAVQTTEAQADNAQIGDIIVTATRREERLQQVPVTVTAISSDSLSAAGITDTTQLTQVVPGVISGGRSNAFFTPTIRGITTTTTTAESPIAIYIDGVYQPYSASASMKLANISRIEVLRGPQGTLFGRNSTGGLINVITKDPSQDLSGSLDLSYASFNQKTLSGYITSGLTDTLAADITIYGTTSDGYVKDLIRGGTINGEHTFAVRSKWKWKPTNNFNLTLTASHIYSRNDALNALQPFENYSAGYFVNPNAVKTTGSNQYVGDILPKTWLRQTSTYLQGSWDTGPVQLNSVTSYEKDDSYSSFDSDSSPVPLRVITQLRQPAHYVTQEFRAASDYDSPLSWIVGVYMFWSERRQTPLQIDNIPATTVGIPFPNTPLTIAASTTLIQPLNKGFSYAPFGQAKFKFTETLSVIAGIRYTWERQKLDQNINGSTFSSSAVFKNVSPMVSLQYQPSSTTNIYATYNTGFKSGIFNISGGRSPGKTTQDPVSPELVKNFELGIKADVTPKLRVNANGFYFHYTDQQVQVRSATGVATFINAGKSNVSGAEAEITYRPVRKVSLRATAAYLNAKYASFPNAPVFVPTIINGVPAGYDLITSPDLKGKYMLRAPKFTFGLAPEFNTDLGSGTLTLSGNAFYSSKYYFDPANLIPQNAYWNFNARISYVLHDSGIVASVFGTNLGNKDILVAGPVSQFTAQAAYDSPRVIGASLGVRF